MYNLQSLPPRDYAAINAGTDLVEHERISQQF